MLSELDILAFMLPGEYFYPYTDALGADDGVAAVVAVARLTLALTRHPCRGKPAYPLLVELVEHLI
jgi:hypothetical protein